MSAKVKLPSDLVAPRIAAKKLGVTTRTLKTWELKGKIIAHKTPSGQRRYDISSVNKHIDTGKNYIYARVSSDTYKANLQAQVLYLQSLFPTYEVITDVSSGLDFKRPGIITILDAALKKDIGHVVVSYSDRLTRFGYDLIEQIIDKGGGKLVVLNKPELSPIEELTEDLSTIVRVFSDRDPTLHRYQPKKEETKESSTVIKVKRITNLSNKKSNPIATTVVGS